MIKKILKYAALAVCLIIVVVILDVLNGFFGNPISRLLAKNAAKDYIAQKYPDTDFRTDGSGYNFKTGDYYVRVVSPSSVDTHFEISLSALGRVRHDDYEDVTSGWNTYLRLENEYRELGDTVFNSSDFPYQSDIAFTTLITEDEEIGDGVSSPDFGLALSDLVPDRNYDMSELGKTVGKIVLYVQDDDRSADHACEVLTKLRELFDKAGIGFYAVDFVLQKPKEENGWDESDMIRLENFKYDDINADGLRERIVAANIAE